MATRGILYATLHYISTFVIQRSLSVHGIKWLLLTPFTADDGGGPGAW